MVQFTNSRTQIRKYAAVGTKLKTLTDLLGLLRIEECFWAGRRTVNNCGTGIVDQATFNVAFRVLTGANRLYCALG